MKKFLSFVLTLVLLLGAVYITVQADEAPFTISGAIGNYMVLQRNAKVNIWGWSNKKGEKITVSFKGNTVEGTVDNDGNWLVQLPEMEADTKENTLTVTMGSYSETRTGILVGDVYFVNGQSNAAKQLNACGGAYKHSEIKAMVEDAKDCIRFFQSSRTDATSNNGVYMASPQKDVIPGKVWVKETTKSAKDFSALGFFFAHKMFKETGVPVGVINVSSGGSPVSELMSKEAVEKSGYKRDSATVPATGIYNALMSPFINTTFKAMLYYQGESECPLANSDYGKYNEYLNIYVEDLREKMNYEFPFFYVQISSHPETLWNYVPLQRAVQFDGLKVIKNSAMVVSMDQGYRHRDNDSAHPNYKKPVGERLANVALSKLFNQGDIKYVSSPMPLYAYKTAEGVVIKFENVGDGLKRIGQHTTLSGFRLNNSTANATAEIIGKDEVLIKTSGIVNQVGYGLESNAFVDYPEGKGDLKCVANLGNSNELPAPTFILKKIYASLDEAVGATPTPTTKPEETNQPTNETTPTATTSNIGGAEGPTDIEVKPNNTGVIIGIVAGVVVVAAVVTIVIIKKKKATKTEE